MDERVERQLRWLEEALGRLRIEIMSLAVLVERELDLPALMMPAISRLEGQLETVKDKLSWPKVVSKEEVTLADLSFEGTVAGAESQPGEEGEKTFDLPPGTVCMTEEELAGMGTTIPVEAERKERHDDYR